MPTVLVNLARASICFLHTCYPALVGWNTLPGTYHLTHYSTQDKGYGGDILVYREKGEYVWAVHRVLSIPGEQRHWRLKYGNIAQRRYVTLGCINVEPIVYAKLVSCCSDSPLKIVK